MASKSYIAHYKNKYPGGKVHATDQSLDVYDKDGDHVVSMAKDGHGTLVDRSLEMGCSQVHDLAPLPKQARIHKLHAKGNLVLDEEHQDREDFMSSSDAAALLDGGRVKSIAEVGKKNFDDAGNYLAPKVASA